MQRGALIYDVIRDEHRKILALAERLEQTTNQTTRPEPERWRQLSSVLRQRLDAQIRVERDLLAPRLRVYPETRTDADTSDRQNRELDERLASMEETSVTDAKFRRHVEIFACQLRQHVERVQREIFPRARRVLSEEEARAIGARARDAVGAAEEIQASVVAPRVEARA